METVYLVARGTVQNVMFRQTVIRAAITLGLTAGATNNKEDFGCVDLSLSGPKEKIENLISKLETGKELNSWGAKVSSLERVESGWDPLLHKVNTSTIDNFDWDPNVEFYI